MRLKLYQRGALLMAAIVLVVIIVAMVTAMSFLSVSNIGASGSHMSSSQAYFIARSGLQRALFQYETGTTCSAASNQNNLTVGAGSFSTTFTLFSPANTTLSAAITNTATVIPVASIAGYAPHGRISIIDPATPEEITYAGTSNSASVCGTAPCFTGATRGAASTTAAAHASGVTVIQHSQCLIRSTGTVGSANRILESSILVPASQFAFLDGASTQVGTSATNIGSLATTLSAGDNLIIVSVNFRNTNAVGSPVQNIAAGALQLKKGAAVLASNQFIITAAGAPPASNTKFPEASQFLLYRDAGAAANVQYDVFATANVAPNANGVLAGVKMLVINGVPPYSSFGSGGTVALSASCAAGTTCSPTATLVSLSSTVPAGNNVVLAAVQLDDSTVTAHSNGYHTLVLNRTGLGANQCASISGVPPTCIAANQETNTLASSTNPARGAANLLIAQDVGAPANPTYFVTGGDTGTAPTISGQASILVLNGLQYAYFANSSSKTVTAAASLITLGGGSTATTFPAGSVVVVAHTQYLDQGVNDTINAGAEQIRFNGATVSSNQFQVALGISCGNQCGDFTEALLYGVANAAPNPTYDLWTAESNAVNNTNTHIVTFHLPTTSLLVDTQEIFP